MNRKEYLQETESREKFCNAFWCLMQGEKPIDQISIDELSEQAGLSRRTFYRHFKSVDEVLIYIFQIQVEILVSYYQRQESRDLMALAKMLFDYCYDHDDIFIPAMNANGKLGLFFQYFQEETLQSFAESFQDEQFRHKDYLQRYVTGGLCGILIKWIEDGKVVPPPDMYKVVAYTLRTDLLT